MITTRVDDTSYVIRYNPVLQGKTFLYSFKMSFLPTEIQKRISSLSIFRNSELNFYLNSEQEVEVAFICEKIENELQSEYIFTEDLQRTYLTELIHFLIKVQQKNFGRYTAT